MSSFGQGWKVKLSASTIVPTGRAFLATSTLGPTGTAAGAAAACCAPAPANIFLAMKAVTTAMTRAPTSRASFFTSMALSPPLDGPSQLPHTSGKMVKKALGENRGENREGSHCNRYPVRNFRTSLALLDAMPDDQDQCQGAACERHEDKELHGHRGRE